MSKLKVLSVLLLLTSCTRVYVPNNNSNPLNPSSITGTKIEYRVTGNASQARVKHSNDIDGITQVVTALPYIQSFNVDGNNIFVTLEAAPLLYPATVSFPFTTVQIFIDGKVFREAASADWSTPISISGTYRR